MIFFCGMIDKVHKIRRIFFYIPSLQAHLLKPPRRDYSFEAQSRYRHSYLTHQRCTYNESVVRLWNWSPLKMHLAQCALMSSSLHCSVTCGANGGTAQPIKCLWWCTPARTDHWLGSVQRAYWHDSYILKPPHCRAGFSRFHLHRVWFV